MPSATYDEVSILVDKLNKFVLDKQEQNASVYICIYNKNYLTGYYELEYDDKIGNHAFLNTFYVKTIECTKKFFNRSETKEDCYLNIEVKITLRNGKSFEADVEDIGYESTIETLNLESKRHFISKEDEKAKKDKRLYRTEAIN